MFMIACYLYLYCYCIVFLTPFLTFLNVEIGHFPKSNVVVTAILGKRSGSAIFGLRIIEIIPDNVRSALLLAKFNMAMITILLDFC